MEQEIQEPEVQVPQHEKCEALFWNDIQQGNKKKLKIEEQQKIVPQKPKIQPLSGCPEEIPEVHRQPNVNCWEEMNELDYSNTSYMDDRDCVRTFPLTGQERILVPENQRLKQELRETQKERDNLKFQLVDTRDELETTQIECQKQIENLQKKLLELRRNMHPRNNMGMTSNSILNKSGLMKEVTRKKERVRRLRARNENSNSIFSSSTGTFEDSCSLSSHEMQEVLYPIVSEDSFEETGGPEALLEKIGNIDLIASQHGTVTRGTNTSENQSRMTIDPKKESDVDDEVYRLSAKIDLLCSEKECCVQENTSLRLKVDDLATKIVAKDKQLEGVLKLLSETKQSNANIRLKEENAVDSLEVEDILLYEDLQYLENDDHVTILSASSSAIPTRSIECSPESLNQTKRTSVLEHRLKDLLGVNKEIEDMYFQLKESNPLSADQYESQHSVLNKSRSRFAELLRKLSNVESGAQETTKLQLSKQPNDMERGLSSLSSSFPVGNVDSKDKSMALEPELDRFSSAFEQLEYELLLTEDVAYLQEDFGSTVSYLLPDSELDRCSSDAKQLDDELLLADDIRYLQEEGFDATEPELDQCPYDVKQLKDQLLLAEDVEYLQADFCSVISSALNGAIKKVESLSSRLEALFALRIITDCARQIECSVLEQDFICLEQKYLELENILQKYQQDNSMAAMRISSLDAELRLSRKRNEELHDEMLLREDIQNLEYDFKSAEYASVEANDHAIKNWILNEALYVAEDFEFLLTDYDMKKTDTQLALIDCEGNTKDTEQEATLFGMQDGDENPPTTSDIELEHLPGFLEAADTRSAELQKQVEESRISLSKALEDLNSTDSNHNLSPLVKCEPSSIQHQTEKDRTEEKQRFNDEVVATMHNRRMIASVESMQSQIDKLTQKVNLLEERNLATLVERDRIEQDERELQETFAFISNLYAESCKREASLSSDNNALKSSFNMFRFVYMEGIQMIEDEISLVNLAQNSGTSDSRVLLQTHNNSDVERLEPYIEECDCEWINAAYSRFKANLKLLHDMNTARVLAIEDEQMHLELKLEESETRFETYMAELSTLRSSHSKERGNLEDSLLSCHLKMEEAQSTTERLKTEIVRLQYSLESTMAEKEVLIQDNLSLRKEVTELVQGKSEIEQHMNKIKGQCDRHEKSIHSRSREIDVLVQANRHLENNLKVLAETSEKDHQDMLKRNTSLDGLLKNSHHRLVKLDGDIEMLRTELNDTKGQLDKALKQRSFFKEQVQFNEDLLDNQSTMIQTLQKETNDLRIQSAQLSALSACLVRQRDLANQKVDMYRQRDGQLQRDVNSLWSWG